MTDSKSTSIGGLIFKVLLLLILFVPSIAAQGLKVNRIQFIGNRHFSSNELEKILKTRKKAEFSNKLLRLDRILLRNFYTVRGYLDVWVETSVDRKNQNIQITYQIIEGKQFLLGEIEVAGAEMVSATSLRKKFIIQAGDVFQRQKIENGLNAIERFYFNRGKPYVELREEQLLQDSLIFITLNIRENETVFIRSIDYSGLGHSKQFIIRREMEIKTGDMYSREKLERSQRNIYSTGLFDFVGMDIIPQEGNRSDVQLRVRVVEKKSRWVGAKFGVAYEQETVYGGTFDITLEFGHRNLFGTARTLSMKVIPSLNYDFGQKRMINPKNQYSITYVEPWIGYTRTPGILNASFYQVRPVNSANYNFFSSSLRIAHEFSSPWKAAATFSFNRVQILESDTLDGEFFAQTRGQDFIYSLGLNAVRDKRDNYLNPQEGSVVGSDVKFVYSNSRDNQTGQTSMNRFFKVTLQWNRYQRFPLRRRWIFASRVKGGSILELGRRVQIPIVERYYLGGASSVRGYSEQLLGPVAFDASGKPVALGGKLLLLANLELRFPIYWLFWGELFTDAGNVWAEYEQVSFSAIKSSSGAGLALITPLGPVRFDYGIKHRPEKWEDHGEFHISISFAF